METETATTTASTTTIPIHTTHTTTSKSQITQIRLETSYAYSLGGLLKMTQILLNLVGLILIQSSGDHARLSRAIFYSFVAATGICVSCLLLLVYLFRIHIATRLIPWFKTELVYCILWIMFELIAGLLHIGVVNGYFDTAGYFAFAAMGTYALEAFYKLCSVTIRSV
ncbi:hypothetical protein NQ315_008088 [Exocentrus adspersus]|uniref:MARVEL domain-containing protein n=1 Tax=Exocentrus adspersus TaxID=1586481 RepID=A0AAV8VVJ2_9CUCU|nr:hypothetical protein NQ315_008088 [Exocentrus adspersus]